MTGGDGVCFERTGDEPSRSSIDTSAHPMLSSSSSKSQSWMWNMSEKRRKSCAQGVYGCA